jgi:DNA-binding LacI/PurR family transcriptional regulator
MPAPLPSLRSLASTLGLSHNTVALALRGDPRVTPSTAARVLALATRVGYRSNPLVSRIFSEVRRHRCIEVAEELFFVNCSPWRKPEDNETGGGYLTGCRKRAQQLGYSVSVWSLHPESTLTWPQLVRISHSRGVRGWLVWGIGFSPNELTLPGDVAFIAINYALQAHAINRVMPQHFLVITTALAELRARGYRRIGFILPDDINRTLYRQWEAAYYSHLPEAQRVGLFPLASTESLEAHTDRLARWLRAKKPDAILTWHHTLPEWLRANGWRVPQQCAVADVDLPQKSKASGIDQGNERIGAVAVDCLGMLITNRSFGPREITQTLQIKPVWRDGNTVLLRRKTASC